MRKQIAAANWKMNLTLGQADNLVAELLEKNIVPASGRMVVLAVPFPYLHHVNHKISGRQNYFVAAQDISMHRSGAYTGETSAEMVQSLGVNYVVLGHSERREYQKESNQELAAKVDMARSYGLHPIFCCGEPLSVRDENKQNPFVQQQLEESLFHLSPQEMNGFVIAYEPIWAIGTGRTASSAQAQEMHAHIRAVLAEKFGKETADFVSILYGGSVKASNSREIFSQPDVDGGLVGGASLSAPEFAEIIKSLK